MLLTPLGNERALQCKHASLRVNEWGALRVRARPACHAAAAAAAERQITIA